MQLAGSLQKGSEIKRDWTFLGGLIFCHYKFIRKKRQPGAASRKTTGKKWRARGAERRGEEGSARTNQSSWKNATRRKHSPIATLRTKLQTRHRKGEFPSFLARGSPDFPPHATFTPSFVLILRPPLCTCVCGRFRLPGYVARMAGPRTDFYPSSKAPPRGSEPTHPQKQLKRYLPSVDPQLTSIRPRRSLI